MGETRVNLHHLLEDIRDSYPVPQEEVIVTELVANSLDSHAGDIHFIIDSQQSTLTVIDNGKGMDKKELEGYHNIASTTKTRGMGIGFAGVGAKLSLLIAKEVITETVNGNFHGATRWKLENSEKAPWKFIEPSDSKLINSSHGTAVSIMLKSNNSELLNPEFIKKTIRTHFYTILDITFQQALKSIYRNGMNFYVNEEKIDLRYRKSIQGAIEPILKEFGEISESREKAAKELRPLEKEIWKVLDSMIIDFPELNPLVANRRKYENNTGVLPNSFTSNVGIPIEEGDTPAETSNVDDTASGADNEKKNMDKEENTNENLPILDAEALETGLPQEGKRKSQGLMIGFYDNKGSSELGKLEDGTVWINNEHPAYKRVAKNNNQYKAATLFDKINDETKNIKEELRYIESDYTILISNICQLFYRISMEPKKKTDPRLYWLVGDNLIRFIERIGDLGFYLLKQNKTFAADIGISESSVSKIILFRKRFLKISALDTNISWSKYRDNKI